MRLGSLDTEAKAGIEALVENGVAESRFLEYKRELPGCRPKDRDEFLADVTSFANALGGDILYGVEAKNGVPRSPVGGLSVGSLDDEILRLEDWTRHCVEPRIPGLIFHPVKRFQNGPVLIVRVPQSWMAPHAVRTKNKRTHLDFHLRHNAGKAPMDIDQLRSAFLKSGALVERVRAFRSERLDSISQDSKMSNRPLMMLHVIPFSAFGWVDKRLGISKITKEFWIGGNPRVNLDGYRVERYSSEEEHIEYCQVFFTGIVEYISTRLIYRKQNIYPRQVEKRVVEVLRQFLLALHSLEVLPPIVVFLTLLRVEGAHLTTIHWIGQPIDRQTLLLPELVLEEYNVDAVSSEMRPVFDALWHAGGVEGSYSYDEEGEWHPDD